MTGITSNSFFNKISDLSQPKPRRGRGGGDWSFSEYAEIKNQKLDKQLESERVNISTIFQNVCIYVNGRTDPSAEELKRLMQLHGGKYLNYYSHNKVTHIIASNLCIAKIKQLRCTPVVDPEWVTDSIATGKQLSIHQYRRFTPREEGQKALYSLTFNNSGYTDQNKIKCHKEIDKLPCTDSVDSVSLNMNTEENVLGIRPVTNNLANHDKEHYLRNMSDEPGINPTDVVPNACDSHGIAISSTSNNSGVTEAKLYSSISSAQENGKGAQFSCEMRSSISELIGLKNGSAKDHEIGSNEATTDAGAFESIQGKSFPILDETTGEKDQGYKVFSINDTIERADESNMELSAHEESPSTIYNDKGNSIFSIHQQKNSDDNKKDCGHDLVLHDDNQTINNHQHHHNSEVLKGFEENKHSGAQSNKLTEMQLSKNQYITGSMKHSSTSTMGPSFDQYNSRVSGKNPNFVRDYYAQSRLHHLSTCGTYARDFIYKIQQEFTQTHPSWSFSQPTDPNRVIVHIDLDAFFVSVGLLSRPNLNGKPVVLAHGEKVGNSEISSCNYVAREKGVRNGMMMMQARQLCPELNVIPYEFDKYKQASEAFYRILIQHTIRIQAVSMDEAYLDLTKEIACEKRQSNMDDRNCEMIVNAIVQRIRQQIQHELGICASAGIAHNMLLARMATFTAKPNGQYLIRQNEAEEYMANQPVERLPGVGWSTQQRLTELRIHTCLEARSIPLHKLKLEFGEKVGAVLFDTFRGIDKRSLKMNEPPKSVSVEISWGVRFSDQQQVNRFLNDLVTEVTKRLKAIGRKALRCTVRVKERKKTVGNPFKYLGHGPCNDHNRTMSFKKAVDDCDVFFTAAQKLYKATNISPVDVRGIGVSLHKLVDESPAQTFHTKGMKTLERFIHAPSRTCQNTVSKLQEHEIDLQQATSHQQMSSQLSSNQAPTHSTRENQLQTHDRQEQSAHAHPQNCQQNNESCPMLSNKGVRNPTTTLRSILQSMMSKVDPLIFLELPTELQTEIAEGKGFDPNQMQLLRSFPFEDIVATYTELTGKAKSPTSIRNDIQHSFFPSPSQWSEDVVKELPHELVQQLKAESTNYSRQQRMYDAEHHHPMEVTNLPNSSFQLQPELQQEQQQWINERNFPNCNLVQATKKPKKSIPGRKRKGVTTNLMRPCSRKESTVALLNRKTPVHANNNSENVIKDRVSKYMMPTLSQIDVNSLNALPPALQEEIKSNLEKKNARQTCVIQRNSLWDNNDVVVDDDDIKIIYADDQKSNCRNECLDGESIQLVQEKNHMKQRIHNPSIMIEDDRTSGNTNVNFFGNHPSRDSSDQTTFCSEVDKRPNIFALAQFGPQVHNISAKPNLFGCHSLKTIQSIISDWCDSCAGAADFQVSALATLFAALIGAKRMEDVEILLRYFRRQALQTSYSESDSERCNDLLSWRSAFNTILSEANQHIETLFSANLEIFPFSQNKT